jgi:hypothetical protein
MSDGPIEPKQRSFWAEFIEFLRGNKKLWLIPLALLAVLVLLAITLAQAGALAPFMYTPS